MTGIEVAWAFAEIADLLEIKGENPFKVRAYRKGARVMQNLAGDVGALASSGRLRELPGLGEALTAKAEEMARTGRLAYLERLRQEVPGDLRRWLAIPGLGPRSVRTIHEGLGIATLEELEAAAREKKVRTLKGLGSKTELAILRGVEMLRSQQDQAILGVALPLADMLAEHLRALPGVARVEAAGEVRRGCALVPGVILLVGTTSPATALDVFARHPQLREVQERGADRVRAVTWLGITVEMRVVDPAGLAPAWFLLTGSPAHLERLGVREGNVPGGPDEEAIYRSLQLPYIPPELREDRGEVEAARRHALPRLLEEADIRADLHVHTDWSDGVTSLAGMVEAARQRGYTHLAITDHSRSLGVARGLPLEKLLRQHAEIRELNRNLAGFTVLTGVEVDILADGRLDYPDEVLASADLVIASVHTGFQQEEEQITARIERALANPHVDILAHPTGRLLGRRPGYGVDMERVLEVAARTGTILEINSSPDRLDLDDTLAREAARRGIPIAINTDAHDSLRLSEMRYGVLTARRAWLEAENVINTWDLARLRAYLAHKSERHGP